MGRSSVREQIVEAGVRVLHERGYSACGVREITEAAGVPLGSFTNHFRSKEGFASVVLDRYFEGLTETMAVTLEDEHRPPLEQILAYLDAIDDSARPLAWRYGCLIANLGLEMPAHSEVLRLKLADLMRDLTTPFARAVRAAQASGQVRQDCDADELAVFILAGWHGAVLRAKVERSGEPLALYRRTLRQLITPVTLDETSVHT